MHLKDRIHLVCTTGFSKTSWRICLPFVYQTTFKATPDRMQDPAFIKFSVLLGIECAAFLAPCPAFLAFHLVRTRAVAKRQIKSDIFLWRISLHAGKLGYLYDLQLFRETNTQIPPSFRKGRNLIDQAAATANSSFTIILVVHSFACCAVLLHPSAVCGVSRSSEQKDSFADTGREAGRQGAGI